MVFVVHGRNDEAREALFDFLRSIGLHPKEWSQAIQDTGEATPYVGRILDVAFDKAQAVIVLMTPDDEAWLRRAFRKPDDAPRESRLTPQPRQNVLFEAGMAMGRTDKRTILVQLGDLRPFSDIFGRHVVRFDGTPQKRNDLVGRLRTAECDVDISGNDWLKAGDFVQVIKNIEKSLFDETDLRILEEVKSNTSITTTYLATELDLPRKELLDRAHVLEQRGLIRVDMRPEVSDDFGGLRITIDGIKELERLKGKSDPQPD
jgi:hypothetical protein